MALITDIDMHFTGLRATSRVKVNGKDMTNDVRKVTFEVLERDTNGTPLYRDGHLITKEISLDAREIGF